MGLLRKGGTTILQDHDSIVGVRGVPGRCLHHKLRGHTHQDDRLDISTSQHAVESCPIKRVHAGLSDHGLIAHWLYPIDYL
jgi:hypothetical protein